MSTTNPLGPLPGSSRSDELEDASILAFRTALPADRFYFRHEGGKDKGVDAALELRADGQPTNIRAQVQLKSTDSDEHNIDGSVSCSVKVRNVNYLLYG